jgi:hypothetical protein
VTCQKAMKPAMTRNREIMSSRFFVDIASILSVGGRRWPSSGTGPSCAAPRQGREEAAEEGGQMVPNQGHLCKRLSLQRSLGIPASGVHFACRGKTRHFGRRPCTGLWGQYPTAWRRAKKTWPPVPSSPFQDSRADPTCLPLHSGAFAQPFSLAR